MKWIQVAQGSVVDFGEHGDKPSGSEKNVSQCLFVHHKSHMD
jgi:hypothetical protein